MVTIAVSLAFAVGLIAGKARREQATRAGFLALAVVLAIGAGLGVYHAGIEWGFWPGPGTCAGVAPTSSGNILDALKNPPRFVSCDEGIIDERVATLDGLRIAWPRFERN